MAKRRWTMLKSHGPIYMLDPRTKGLPGSSPICSASHGALDNLPHWDRITVSRPSANYSKTVFQKGTNDWNRFTLLETLLNFYRSNRSRPSGGGANTQNLPAVS